MDERTRQDSDTVAFLTVMNGEFAGEPFRLTGQTTTLGRHRSSDIQLLRSGVSRNQCVVTRRPDGVYSVFDADSRNGTYVNGRRISGLRMLRENDVVRVGDVRLQFSTESLQSDWLGSETETASPDGPFGEPDDEPGRHAAMLVAVGGADAGTVFKLSAPRSVLGREGSVDIQLQDSGVSRRHAAIHRAEDLTYTIEDFGSSNGTYLNQLKLAETQPLNEGDLIRLGWKTVLRFVNIGSHAVPPLQLQPCHHAVTASFSPLDEGNTDISMAMTGGNPLDNELEKEMSQARDVQMAMVPPQGQLFDTAAARFAGTVRPASFAGGDLWTHFEGVAAANDALEELAEDSFRQLLLIADVTGHGMGPAMITTVAKSSLDTVLLGAENISIQQAFATMNKVILGISKQAMVMTAFAAEIAPGEGILNFCSAGHIPQLLLRRQTGTIEALFEPNSAPLGQTHESCFETRQVAYDPGDVLIMFTDGVTEAVDADGRNYGNRRLQQFIIDNASREPQQLQSGIIDSVVAFCDGYLNDDATVVVAELANLKTVPALRTYRGYPVDGVRE